MGKDGDGGRMTWKRSHDIADVSISMEGQEVTLGGWIEDVRVMGKVTFATLRDHTGMAQAVAKGDAAGGVAGAGRQSAVGITGTIQGTRARGLEYEVLVSSIEVLGRAEHPLPVDPIGRQGSNIDTRLDHRALDMRNQRTAAIFRIRHRALQYARRHLDSARYTEITTPKIIGSASEGGADLFSMEYFGKSAYLAQSPQLYKEQMTLGLGRVFEIASFYRAEKSHTGRHLSEFTSVDIEGAFMDCGDVMAELESLVRGMITHVAGSCAAELGELGTGLRDPGPFERLTYRDCVKELRGMGEDVEEGGDLLDSHLRVLGGAHPGYYFITGWPTDLKPFYIMGSEADPAVSESFDLQHGHLELSSGGTRIHRREDLAGRLAAKGLDPAQFGPHLESFGWGMPPHSGWGLGLDRLVAVLAGLDNVREAVLYPRDPDRLTP